jgi:nucleotide-binding universal stress UspA family protein
MSKAPLLPVVDADQFLYGVVRLFTGRPDLPEKILSPLARDKGSDKPALFVIASGEAFGAEHYFAEYRVLRPEEIDLAVGALNATAVVVGTHEASARREMRHKTRGYNEVLTPN